MSNSHPVLRRTVISLQQNFSNLLLCTKLSIRCWELKRIKQRYSQEDRSEVISWNVAQRENLEERMRYRARDEECRVSN